MRDSRWSKWKDLKCAAHFMIILRRWRSSVGKIQRFSTFVFPFRTFFKQTLFVFRQGLTQRLNVLCIIDLSKHFRLWLRESGSSFWENLLRRRSGYANALVLLSAFLGNTDWGETGNVNGIWSLKQELIEIIREASSTDR